MRRALRTGSRAAGLPLAVAALALTSLTASTAVGAAAPASRPVAAPAALSAAAVCSPVAEASFAPLDALPAPGKMPAGTLQKIAQRGQLIVGVSGDTRLLGARNPLQNGALEGFDILVAREVAAAIFGPTDVDKHITYKVITGGQRIPLLNAGTVDLVARAMTINCDRWGNADAGKRVAFSQVYFKAKQDVLVRKDSTWRTIQDVAAAKASVCAPSGSTSLDLIKTVSGIVPVEKSIHSDCLAAWQQGEVDAITGDDAILAGFKDQDPRAKLMGLSLEDEPYGLAVKSGDVTFVRFLNAVLDAMEADGRWQSDYAKSSLEAAMGPRTPPTPNTGRPLTWTPPAS